jgi:hypothetical protein
LLKPFEKNKKVEKVEKKVENAVDDEVVRIPGSHQNTASQNTFQSKDFNNFYLSKDSKFKTSSNVNFNISSIRTNKKVGGKY